MVLSYNESPYRELMEAQNQTWDSVEVDGVETVYYYGSLLAGDKVGNKCIQHLENGRWSREVQFKCTDAYYLMAHKLKLALEYVKDWEYDYIFRSNSSSFICKQRLKEFAETLPKEKLYAGWEIEGNAGYNVCSGAGFFLSRDTAEILRENIDPKFEREEDVYCAQLLHEKGIKIIDDKSRFDVGTVVSGVPTGRYHYKLKNGNRLMDAENMKVLHKLITG